MKVICATQALLPDGWASDVRVGISDDGRIAFVRQGDLNDADTDIDTDTDTCLLYTSPSPRDRQKSRMPSSA